MQVNVFREDSNVKKWFDTGKLLLAPFLTVMLLVSCGGGSGDPSNFRVQLTDAATDLYQAIYVTIVEVQVIKKGCDEDADASCWESVLYPQKTVNLLELVNGVREDLGETALAAGDYGQMRLILGTEPDDSQNILGQDHPSPNYLIKNDTFDTIEELKVPSGLQTGIKIIHGFTIEPSGFTDLILDFDAGRSVVQAGKSGKWLLKPVIKVLETVTYAAVSGAVQDNGNTPIEGALISAQVYTASPADPWDEVAVAGGTVSDVLGSYTLHLEPGTYNIVATMAGYSPQCQVVEAIDSIDYTGEDFTLLPAATSGTLTATVTGDRVAVFSIRKKPFNCGSGEVTIEVASVTVSNESNGSGTSSDPVLLETGIYEVVVASEGAETYIFENIEVTVDMDTGVVYPPTP